MAVVDFFSCISPNCILLCFSVWSDCWSKFVSGSGGGGVSAGRHGRGVVVHQEGEETSSLYVPLS